MIFISFSSLDAEYASKLNTILTSQGIKTWFAPGDVKASSNYANDIISAIKESQSLLLLFSINSNNSPHVQKEIDLAIKYKKKVYPIRIEDIMPTEAMEYFLSGVQWRDAYENFESSIHSFIDELRLDLGLKEDAVKKLNESTIKDFASQHFKHMGYKIMPNSEDNWEEFVKSYEFDTQAIQYLKKNAIAAYKQNTQMIIIPKFLDSSTVPNFKIREADYFWKARKIIWKHNALEQICTQFEIDIDDDDIDFKIKSNIADMHRRAQTDDKNITLLFYLFVKQQPTYKTQQYHIPLEKISEYIDGEVMPNLYLNYTYKPNWWGYGKNDIEGIPGNRYVKFADALNKTRFESLKRSGSEYEQYNGRIAETLAEVFLKRNNLVVQQFGVESILGNSLSFMQRSNTLEDDHAADTIRRFMTSPDLLVIKLDEEDNIKNSYFMDVKYRSCKDKEDFSQILSKNEDLYKQAQKYQQNWDRVYLFLFLELKHPKDIEIYILSVQDILTENYHPLKIEEDYIFGWLDNEEIKDLYTNAKNYWLK